MSHRYRSQNETRVPRLHSPGQGVVGSSDVAVGSRSVMRRAQRATEIGRLERSEFVRSVLIDHPSVSVI